MIIQAHGFASRHLEGETHRRRPRAGRVSKRGYPDSSGERHDPKKDEYMRGYHDGFKDGSTITAVTDDMVAAAQDAWIKTRLKSAENHKAAMRAALVTGLTKGFRLPALTA